MKLLKEYRWFLCTLICLWLGASAYASIRILLGYGLN